MTDNARIQRLLSGFVTVTQVPYLLGKPDVGAAGPYAPVSVRAAVDIVQAEPRASLTTAALASRSHVSARTLQAGFRRHLGMSPMEYLRSVRLSRAHDDLLAADPARETVTTIAQRWGFTNLSRFAQQHRALFGETPAATLSRAAVRSPGARTPPAPRPHACRPTPRA